MAPRSAQCRTERARFARDAGRYGVAREQFLASAAEYEVLGIPVGAADDYVSAAYCAFHLGDELCQRIYKNHRRALELIFDRIGSLASGILAEAEAALRRGARRLLEDLRDAGRSTVILTNGTVDPQRVKAEQSGLLHLVAGVVVTEEIGFHKPDPRAFAAALALTGDSAPRAAMVGDRWEFDIEGALEAGFRRAVWVSRSRRRPADPPVKIVKSLPQVLPALLERRA